MERENVDFPRKSETCQRNRFAFSPFELEMWISIDRESFRCNKEGSGKLFWLPSLAQTITSTGSTFYPSSGRPTLIQLDLSHSQVLLVTDGRMRKLTMTEPQVKAHSQIINWYLIQSFFAYSLTSQDQKVCTLTVK